MKKLLFIAAAVVAMVACNKAESSVSISNPEEIGLYSMAKNATRGYVWGTAFKYVENPDTIRMNSVGSVPIIPTFFSSVKANDSKQKYDWREMVVSAYNDDDETDYFTGKTFTKTGTNNIWRSTPAIYWPIKKELQFLAYSSKNINGRTEPVANWDGAKKVSFEITSDQCYQNDIMYAQTSGNNKGITGKKSSDSQTGLATTFYHSQAWLTFNITAIGKDSLMKNIVKVDKIVLKNVYNSGLLTFEYNDTAKFDKPKASWNFFTQCASDVVVDDPWGVLNPTTATVNHAPNGYIYAEKKTIDSQDYNLNGLQLNMLMPEQKHNNFVLYYTIDGKQFNVELSNFNDVTINTSADNLYTSNYPAMPGKGGSAKGLVDNWYMGFHYIYNITIEINEISFKPSVNMWTMVQGFATDPTQI